MVSMDKLFRTLKKEIVNIKTNRAAIENIKKKMYENHLFLRGNVQEYIHHPDKIVKEKNRNFVILFTKYLYDTTKNYNLDPAEYFTEEEIGKALEYKCQKPTNELVLHKVEILGRRICETRINISYIPKLFSITGYNFDVVRNYKVVPRKQGDTVVAEKVLDLSNAQIKKRLKQIEEDGISNIITFNINPKSNKDSFYYNSEDKSLLLKDNAMLELVDGVLDMHALIRISDSLKPEKTGDYSDIKVILTFFNDRELAKYLAKQKILKGGII